MKLTPANIASLAAIPNGSIIKKVDNDNFAEVVQSDITALGFTPGGGGWTFISSASYTHPTGTMAGNTSVTMSAMPVGTKYIIIDGSTNASGGVYVGQTVLTVTGKTSGMFNYWNNYSGSSSGYMIAEISGSNVILRTPTSNAAIQIGSFGMYFYS